MGRPALAGDVCTASGEWRFATLLPRLSKEQGRPVGQLALLDVGGCGIFRMLTDTAGWAMFSQMRKVSQDNYPEGVEQCIFANAPWYFDLVLGSYRTLAALFVGERVLSTVQVVSRQNTLRVLEEQWDPDGPDAGDPPCAIERECREWMIHTAAAARRATASPLVTTHAA